jgi:hypothetical protein
VSRLLSLADVEEEEAVGASYEAVVLAADRTALIHQLNSFAENTSMSFEAYRVADPGVVIFGWTEGIRHWGPAELEIIEGLAEELSRYIAKAVAVHFDEMLQVREATLYQEGELIQSFGEEDEFWAPKEANGDVLPDGSPCPQSAVPESEGDVFWDGIDAGLQAAGFWSLLPAGRFMYVADPENLIWERSRVAE